MPSEDATGTLRNLYVNRLGFVDTWRASLVHHIDTSVVGVARASDEVIACGLEPLLETGAVLLYAYCFRCQMIFS